MWKLKLFRGKYAAVRRINNTTQRCSLRTNDKDLAQQRFDDFIRLQAAPNETCEKIYNLYRSEKSESEQKKMGYMWNNLKQDFANYRPDQIDRAKAMAYTARRREQGVMDGTIIRELGSFRSALRRFNKNYPTTYYTPPPPEPKDDHLTKPEFYNLLKFTAAPHIKLFMILALATGGRTTAVLQIKWGQVDFTRKQLKLGRGNGNKGRATVPLNDLALDALQEAYHGRTCDQVIEYNSSAVKSIKKGFCRTVERAGMRWVTPHILRHSAAVWMAEAGIPMSEISQYLGHKNTQTTERVYARYSPDYLRKAANVLQ